MTKVAFLLVLLALTACASAPPAPPDTRDPCAAGQNTWDCQIERYRNVAY